jgi:hypothetical protein
VLCFLLGFYLLLAPLNPVAWKWLQAVLEALSRWGS